MLPTNKLKLCFISLWFAEWFSPEALVFLPYLCRPAEGGISLQPLKKKEKVEPTRDLYFGICFQRDAPLLRSHPLQKSDAGLHVGANQCSTSDKT